MSEWKTVRLGDVCEIINGFAFDSKLFNTEKKGIPLIRIRDVIRGFSETYTTENADPRFLIKSGDLLIGMDGEFNCSLWKSEDSFLNQRVCKIVPNDDLIHKEFVYYVLQRKLKEIEDKTSFVTVKHISSKQIENIILKQPSLETQKQIASQLDKCTEIITKHKQMLEKYDILIKSRFIEMFGNLANNTKKWIIKNFTECAIIDTKMVKDFEKYADYPHIGIDSIEKETGVLSGYRTVKEDNVISGKYLFTPEHIIYSKIRPNLNKVAMPNFEGLCSADAYPILVKKNIATREYLTYVMRSDFFVSYILAFSRRANMPKVNKEQVESFNLPLPPFELQQQFSSFVQQIDKSKFVVLKSLEKAETLYKSLMQEYFR
ncbi:restriction endonuclease subunit S [uncultured Treponema sp.]|uniref:restriction endonuclease subunit S n=1 Tax=uncultured Treponema sp. TaxID=162155 RepID=UPI0025F0B640|nr:restriction endonuclease subunit S [uncultured Treponema sp.]